MDAAPPVEVHLRCGACGYDLYAIDPAGVCPECGQAISRSRQLWSLLHEPASARHARQMARSMLISSVFAGLCPAAAYFVGGSTPFENDGTVQRGCLLVLVFAVCCAYAISAVRSRRKLLGHKRVVNLASLAELTATCGLAIIASAGMCYAIQHSSEGWDDFTRDVFEEIAASNTGVGFFLIGITAWRAAPEWLTQARVARMMGFGRLRWAMIFMAVLKSLYETLWLGCCWVPLAGHYFAIDWIDEIDLGLLEWAAWGVLYFGIVWALMIAVHSWQFVRIRHQTRSVFNRQPSPYGSRRQSAEANVEAARHTGEGREVQTVLR